ncbi:AMP-binding protein [Lautropia mirabilis ATCC 51599]|uniref:AMP-binding protein n=1 Tax=Lautropia mirabilis TaxID=47671 RepID=UPI00067FAFFE|nr:AMP-binding protein [Lautropia mirabilis]
MQRLLLDPQMQPARVGVAPEWTRADFVAQALRVAARLRETRPRAVALHFSDAARMACTFLACAHEGVAMVLPPNLAADNLVWACEQADVWMTDGHTPDLAQDVANAAQAVADAQVGRGNIEVWQITDDAILVEARHGSLPAQTAQRAEKRAPCPANRAEGHEGAGQVPAHLLKLDTEVWLKTSGSTGQPQIICKTVAQFQAEAEALAQCWGLVDEAPVDAVVGSVSPQHLYGLSFRVVLALCAGWPIHRMQCVYPESLLAAALPMRRSVWISSPMLLDALGEDRVGPRLRGSVSRLVSSAGSLSAATRERLHRQLGILPDEIYGSTETGVIAHRQGSGPWQPLPSVQHGTDAEEALWVDSPWSGGRRQLADLVSPQGKGFVLEGRRDRIIKLADKRVSLAHVEATLKEHAWVADGACGLSPVHKRLAVALVLSPEGATAWREQGRASVLNVLRDHLRGSLDVVALPRSWRVVHRLPRDAQGKLPLAAWQRLFEARPLAPEWARLRDGAEDRQVRFSGQVPWDLVHFGGHFAEFPLVPGVVELDWAITQARTAFTLPPHLIRTEALKFRQFVRPGDALELTLDWQPDKGRLVFELKGPDGICASGRLVLAAHRES